MRKYLHTLLVSTALSMGVAGQAVAYGDDHDDEHDRLGWEHRQGHRGLESRHDDVHEELGEEHSAAHYYNSYMSRRGHRRLHGQLGQEHARQHYRLNWQHNGMHRDLDDAHDDYHGYYAPITGRICTSVGKSSSLSEPRISLTEVGALVMCQKVAR